jgi:hypothetical protein
MVTSLLGYMTVRSIAVSIKHRLIPLINLRMHQPFAKVHVEYFIVLLPLDWLGREFNRDEGGSQDNKLYKS